MATKNLVDLPTLTPDGSEGLVVDAPNQSVGNRSRRVLLTQLSAWLATNLTLTASRISNFNTAVASVPGFGGGGGAVASVNTKTGTVVLTPDDLSDAVSTNKFTSAAEKAKLAGIATAATANSADATLLARANHTGTQSADTLTDGTTNKAYTAAERTKLTAITGTNTGDQTLTGLLPTQAGNNGKVLGTNGTVASWVAAASGSGNGFPSTAKIFFPETYGAVGDGTTDDTAAIQAAINAAAAVTNPVTKYQNASGGFQAGTASPGGGTVMLTSNAYVASNLVLKHRVQLVGLGWNTFLIRKASSTGPLITNQWDGTAHAKYCQVRDLSLHGNKANQTDASALIKWTGDTTNNYTSVLDEDYDNNMYVANVYGWYSKGNGFEQLGSSGNDWFRCHALWNDGRGFVSSQDTKYTQCDAGHSGREGFRIGDKTGSIYADNTMLVNCKSWFSGQVTSTDGYGFVFNCDNGKAVMCEAQDNKRAGFLFDTCNGFQASDLLAEENNSAAGGDPGITLYQAKYCRVTGICKNRYNHTQQSIGCAIGATCSVNVVDLTFMLQTDNWGTSTPYATGYNFGGNKLYNNGALVTS